MFFTDFASLNLNTTIPTRTNTAIRNETIRIIPVELENGGSKDEFYAISCRYFKVLSARIIQT